MERLYRKYKDIAEFRIVYIREAHPLDGRRPSRQAREKGIDQPTTRNERCKTAEILVAEGELTIPIIIDSMKNEVDQAYSAKPDRAFLVDKDGNIGVAGGRGPRGFGPALDDIEDWLKRYRRELESDPMRKTGSRTN